jgi:superfamily II DNA or RNA helicase
VPLRPDRTLRKWQQSALATWRSRDCHGIAEVATGAGKTLFGLAAADDWFRTHPEAALAILVPTSALQDQWAVVLSDEFGIQGSDIVIWPEERDTARRFHLLVVNTARTAMSDIARRHPLLMLIADECHRYASPENRHALVPTRAALGLSATARREHDLGYEDVLVPILGQTIIQYGVDQARRDGLIAPFYLDNVEVQLTATEQADYDRITFRLARALRDADEDAVRRFAILRASVSKRARMRVPVTGALMDEYRGMRSLIFHEDIKSANAITQLLEQRGHSVTSYHTGLGPALRRDNLRQFRSGWYDTLVCCRALDEGIDVPDVELALIASSTGSVRQRIQRLGRALRPAPGKDAARIITLFATEPEQQRLLNEERLLSDVADVQWRRAGVSDATDPR